MRFLESLKLANLKVTIKDVILRFPLSVLLSLFISILFMILIVREFDMEKDTIELFMKLIISSIVTFFLTAATSLFIEHFQTKKFNSALLNFIPIVFWILFFIYFDGEFGRDMELFVYVLLTGFGVMAFLFISPFIQKLGKGIYNQDLYYNYFYKLSTVFLTSCIVGGSLVVLGFIGLGATFSLFELDFIDEGKVFAIWTVISLALSAPIYGLVHIPNKVQINDKKREENKFFHFLVKFVAIPFIFTYFIILYAYTIKVLAHFNDWPNGEVTWLVIGFSIFGYIIYMFSYIYEKENSIIAFFRKFFPFVVVPQVIMLFYAIFLRIQQYDLTINRYFVVVFGLWLLFLSLYFILSNKKYLGIFPLSLGIFIISISIGPWGVYNLPESRQLDRLVYNLEQANILKGTSIIPLERFSDISAELSHEIYSGIDYICDFSNCDSLKELFKDQMVLLEKQAKIDFEERKEKDLQEAIRQNNTNWQKDIEERKYSGLSNEEIVNKLSEFIKVQRKTNNYNGGTNQPKYISMSIDYNESHFPIDILDYDSILKIEVQTSKDELYVMVDVDTQELTIRSGNKKLATASLKSVFDILLDEADKNGVHEILPEKLVFPLSSQEYDIKIFFSEISILNPQYKEGVGKDYSYSNVSGFALIRKK